MVPKGADRRSGNGGKGRKKELLRELTTFVIGKRNEEEAGAKYFLRLHRRAAAADNIGIL